METESLLPKPTYGGIKRYLRRRRYQRIDGGTTAVTAGGKKTKMVKLRSPRRQWRIKSIPKLTWMVRSPLKMMANLKNTYTKFMLKSMTSDNIFENKRIPKVDPKGDAFETRLIFEISKALVASHELYPVK